MRPSESQRLPSWKRRWSHDRAACRSTSYPTWSARGASSARSRLEQALELRPDIPVEVRWRPYFLNDWVPREGISRDEYLTKKFGSPERYKSIAGRVVAAAKAEGLTYNVRQDRAPAEHARLPPPDPVGAQHRHAGADEAAADGALFHRRRATSPTARCWCKAAADCGMDADLTRELLASDRDVDRVTQEAEQAKEAGIDGVPCFIFGGVLAVSGAQDPAYLADAMGRAAEEVEKRGSAATAAE